MRTKQASRTVLSFFVVGAWLLSHPTGAVAAAESTTYVNPVVKGTLADPAVILHNGIYYLYATGEVDGDRGNRVYTSTNLVDWERGPVVFRPGPPHVWAPDVWRDPASGRFFLYYTVNHTVGVAEARGPLGPFTIRRPLFEQAIDAHLFRDDDGRLFLYFVKLPGFRITVQPMAGPTEPTGEPTVILQPESPWETRAGRVTEGPWMIKHAGRYYLLYSGSGANTPDYAVGYATADNPLGPFTRAAHNPIIHRSPGLFGPGHGCAIQDAAKNWWHVYHQKRTERVQWGRFICLDRLWFDESGALYGRATRGVPQPVPAVGTAAAPSIGVPQPVPAVGTAAAPSIGVPQPVPAVGTAAAPSMVPLRVVPFQLKDVRLGPGPFSHAMELNGAYLLRLEPDRLLSNFRANAGLSPKGTSYGGWEKESIAGHSLGHYLSAVSLHFASTGDPRFKKRADSIVDELAACQKAAGDGFVFGFPRGREIFQEIRRGQIRSRGFDLNGCWVPLYNLHKTFAGLADAYRLCSNEKALTVARRLADFLIGTFANLTEAQVQRMLACEHGGINESFAELYAFTGETKYLAAAERIYHKKVLDPLAARQDRLNGLHANTQIPKVVGCARLYELTGKDTYKTISRFFWKTVVGHHTYVNGGHGDNEYFGPPDTLNGRLGATTETCNTYNMLKLTRHLYQWEPDPAYFDYYERALYNHILAHQHPETGMYMYKGFLGMPARKHFSRPFDSFWCCVGTGMENHSKYGESIYFSDGEALHVMLYLPSELSWREKGVTVTQTGTYPFSDAVTLRIAADAPVRFRLVLRRPAWCREGFAVAVNGKATTSSTGGASYTIDRTWKTGDRVNITLPMTLRYESMPDNPNRVAFFYGPTLLCADMQERRTVPLLIAERKELLGHIARAQDGPLHFVISGIVHPPGEVLLRPHFSVHEHRYSVYLDALNAAQWAQKQQEYEQEKRRLAVLEARTTDVLRAGEMQPEREHNLTSSERSYVGDYQDRTWRDARNGGWFEFDMKVDGDEPMELMCEYWGGDRGRIFDILIDGEKIATQKLEQLRPGRFVEVCYPVPEKLTRGKQKVRVRLQGHPQRTAGGLFNARMLRRQK